MKALAALCAVVVVAGCMTTTPGSNPTTSFPPNTPITYTLEPADGDGVFWTQTITQMEFGGSQCPCLKVKYKASGNPADAQAGADEIWRLMQKGTIKPGDQLMGFSLGSQVVSMYMAQHWQQTPATVRVLLAGDTKWRNDQFLAMKPSWGIPWNVSQRVTLVANEFDGWSDFPDKVSAPGYLSAVANATLGSQAVHNYVNAKLDSPANVVEHPGANVTTILIPTQKLPAGGDRNAINGAYTRKSPTPEQLAAATSEQVTVAAQNLANERPEGVAQ